MALTLAIEQRLQRVSLVRLFDKSHPHWKALAKQTYGFLKRNFPSDARVRRDDVAKNLVSLLEVDDQLSRHLSEKRLKQKYWIRDFSDLVLDRDWDDISNP